MFLLVLSSALLVVFSCFMVVFFLKRDVFEIRARYAATTDGPRQTMK